ncbi:hypothetical protein ANO14919_126090 [Xylariales sp. No.14919]|nr:hypothetical protein ANO14919_126090 [Xylariales sp. No.14919]
MAPTEVVDTAIKEDTESTHRNNTQAHPDSQLVTYEPSFYGQQHPATEYGPSAPRSTPRVIQHGSVITSIIELGHGATLDQGDKVLGVVHSEVEQRGAKIGGRIKAEQKSQIRQGDVVHENGTEC